MSSTSIQQWAATDVHEMDRRHFASYDIFLTRFVSGQAERIPKYTRRTSPFPKW